MQELTLEELLQLILRDSGFLMTGGSAQFREYASKDLQLSLRAVQEHANDTHLLTTAQVLAEQATQFVANKTPTSNDSMNLRSAVTSFESAMKAYIKIARR